MAKFAADVMAPKVKAMDETGDMDPEIIRGLFENGVRPFIQLLLTVCIDDRYSDSHVPLCYY